MTSAGIQPALFCVRTGLSAKSLDIHKFNFLIQGRTARAVAPVTLMRKNHGISAKPHVIKRLSIGREEWYTKRKGEIAELIFVIKASSMGFAVSKPYGDSEAYDLVIEENGKLLRIQVKSAFTTSRWGYSVALARNRLGRRAERYSAEEIDFVVAYIVPHDAWYIVPVAEIVGRSHIRLYPEGTRKRDGGSFAGNREAWEVMRVLSS